jgi:glycosyltransferase involved in cell wall biosynthesis
MGQKVTLSVIILQGGNYDKELFVNCLDSVSFADEIIKVETDNLKGSFSDFRNSGAKMAKGEWLLYVDTDEIVTSELKKEVEKTIQNNDFCAYAIPRRNIVLGREMKHCGLWPDYVLRLIKKDCLVSWEGKLHEQPKINGKTGYLKEPLIHKKHDDIAGMVEKTNKWSEVEGRLMFEAHHPPMNFFRFVSAGLREFWQRMILQTAFLDGTEGTIYGLYQVYSRLISYSKLWEMQIQKNEGGNI